MQEIFCQVSDLSLLSSDIYQVKLTAPELSQLNYLAGQYLTLQVDGGRWIPFSIGNAPEETSHIELHIRKIPGHELATQILDQLKATQKAHIQIPMGQCVLRSANHPIIFIAGGTGFSPIKAMIESAIYQKEQRSMHLYWGAQTQSGFYLQQLAEGWQQAHKHISFTPVLSGEDKNWQGRAGLVHHAALADIQQYDHYHYYISGSENMVLAVYNDLLKHSVAKENIFSDILDIKREMGEDI